MTKRAIELEEGRDKMDEWFKQAISSLGNNSQCSPVICCTNGEKTRTSIEMPADIAKKMKEFWEYLAETDYPNFDFFNFVKKSKMKVVFRTGGKLGEILLKGGSFQSHITFLQYFLIEASEHPTFNEK